MQKYINGVRLLDGVFETGSVTLPSVRFLNSTSDGFYRIGTNNIGLSLNGVKSWDYGTVLTTTATPLSFTVGIAMTAGAYQIGRNADATNVLQSNVPTGATYEWSINDVAQMTLNANTLALTSPIAITAYAHGVLPNGFLYFDSVGATGSGFYNGTSAGQMNFWLGSIHGRALCFSNGDIRGQDFDHAVQQYATIYLQGPSNPEADNRQYVNWYNDGSNSYHLTGTGGHRFGFEAIQANTIITFTANPTTNLGVVFTVNTGTLTGTTAAPGANQFQLLATLSLTLDSLVTNWNLIAGTSVVAHKNGSTVVFEASGTGVAANAYVTTETTDTDNVYRFQGQMVFTGNPTTTSGVVFTVGTGTLTGVTGTPAANQFQLGATLTETVNNLVKAYNLLAVGVIAIQNDNPVTGNVEVFFDGGTTGVSIFTETTDTDTKYSFTATTAGGASTVMSGGRAFSAFMDMQPSYQKLTKQGIATAAVTTYASQYLGLIASGWNTGTTVANDVEFRMQTTANTAATINGTFNLTHWRGGVQTAQTMTISPTGVINVGNGTVALPCYSFIDDPDSGFYSIGADNIGLALNGAIEVNFSTTALSPGASDGSALGTIGLMWSDLFLADAGVINFNNGNYTITHSAGLLTTNGALTITGALAGVTNITASGKVSTTLAAITLAAGAVTFVETSNVMRITGDAGGNTIATITGGVSGQFLILIFMDALVIITDTAAQTADTVNLSAAFTSATGTVLTLMFNGTKWFEVARSVN